MKNLGIYRKEYDDVISIYAGMLFQYEKFEQQFEENGCELVEEYTNKAGATNLRKTPLYTAMESLRKDIAVYSDRLQLNPKSTKELVTDNKKGMTKLQKLMTGKK